MSPNLPVSLPRRCLRKQIHSLQEGVLPELLLNRTHRILATPLSFLGLHIRKQVHLHSFGIVVHYAIERNAQAMNQTLMRNVHIV